MHDTWNDNLCQPAKQPTNTFENQGTAKLEHFSGIMDDDKLSADIDLLIHVRVGEGSFSS